MDPKRIKIPDLLQYIQIEIKALKWRNIKQWKIKQNIKSKKEKFLNKEGLSGTLNEKENENNIKVCG